MKKFDKTEKFLIAEVDENYTTYRCDDHGVFQKRNDIDDSKCPWCKRQYKPLENFKELQKKFKVEIGI